MFDLGQFTLSDMTICGAAMRKFESGATSMEAVATRTVRYLFEQLGTGRDGQRCCPLVRFYKTHPYSELGGDLQTFARGLLAGEAASPEMKCLALLATAGELPEWNDRRASVGHRAIPLLSEQMITRFPMISQLLEQLGLKASTVLSPDRSLVLELDQRQYNVFYVPQAEGSAYIPAQEEFVRARGIRSVLGFGGMLPSGNLFAIILFSRIYIPRDVAALFRTLALSAKLAVLQFDGDRVFDQS